MRYLVVLGLIASASVTRTADARTREQTSAPTAPLQIRLRLDTSEADEALVIVERERSGQPVTKEEWKQLFATLPYRELKAREASVGASFTDGDFKAFLSSPSALAQLERWKRTVAGMKSANMRAIGKRDLD
jgi:hypothetical protein